MKNSQTAPLAIFNEDCTRKDSLCLDNSPPPAPCTSANAQLPAVKVNARPAAGDVVADVRGTNSVVKVECSLGNI